VPFYYSRLFCRFVCGEQVHKLLCAFNLLFEVNTLMGKYIFEKEYNFQLLSELCLFIKVLSVILEDFFLACFALSKFRRTMSTTLI